MARAVRFLLRVPAVRRVMLRLANVEAAIDKHHGQLGDVNSQLQRLSASEAGNRALLAQVSEHMPPAQRASLEAAIAQHQAQLGRMNESLQHLIAAGADERVSRETAAQRQQADLEALNARVEAQQAGAEALKVTVDGQQGQLGTLSAALQNQLAELGSLNNSVQVQQSSLGTVIATVQQQQSQLAAVNDLAHQLSSELTNHRTQLAEVSQHLPPAQRANLEATLHGQQLQLGALNSTIHANQIQLGALNDVVQRLSAENASQRALLADVLAQIPPARLVSLEATVAELRTQFGDLNNLVPRLAADEAAHHAQVELMRRRVATPYTFEQLLNRQVEKPGVELAVNIHIPKACGNTTNALFRQMGFLPIALDMSSNDFFHTIREDRWLEGYLAPPPRESYLLTGHLRLDHPIFRRIRTSYVVVTVLRDPIDRILSDDNFTTRTPGSPWYDEVATKGMSFLDYAANIYTAIGPQYSFFDDTGKGTFAPTGAATPERCFNNLTTSIGFYGLTERFDEFAILSGYLLYRPEILSTTPRKCDEEPPRSQRGSAQDFAEQGGAQRDHQSSKGRYQLLRKSARGVSAPSGGPAIADRPLPNVAPIQVVARSYELPPGHGRPRRSKPPRVPAHPIICTTATSMAALTGSPHRWFPDRAAGSRRSLSGTAARWCANPAHSPPTALPAVRMRAHPHC